MSRWINLGCGGNRLPEPWENYDAELDITRPLPFPDSSVAKILIEHCLEHVNSTQGMGFLLEANRVLEPGGVLRVCVPVLDELEMLHARDICMGHGHQQIYSASSLEDFLRAAGFNRSRIRQTGRSEIDGHWRQIGLEKDNLETLRMEATK
jgi:predicted SAM-dependent methyltransferase